MRQVIQSIRTGELRVVDVPVPAIGATEVLVRVSHSVVSAGTERAVRELASASLVGKAKARPDLVRQVVGKARTDGIGPTVKAVRGKLDDDMPLGYSACGEVIEVGEAVAGLSPGQWVATGGEGHADYQAVAGHLAVGVPAGVQPAHAAFATVGAIALHGLRQADVGPGGKVCVVGLGLLGQLTARLAQAAGLDVCGIDLQPWAVERARQAGVQAYVDTGADTTAQIIDWSRGRGVDAVLLTAATKSSGPISRTPALLRDRGVAVVVGDIGLELARTPFYEKELTVRFARSYGPGRYDRSYEEWGVDYPVGQVRFTEGRNLEAVLDLLASGRLRVDDLITHTFTVDNAAEAYETITGKSGPFLGVQLEFPEVLRARPTPAVSDRRSDRGALRLGLLGAGNFARATLAPALASADIGSLYAVASRTGSSARYLSERFGVPVVHSTADELIQDPAVDVVLISTPHDTHANLVVSALEAGKHVFCEKPLALTIADLDRVADAWARSDSQLMVGFNRRHAPLVSQAQQVFPVGGGPLVITYRVNAGNIPVKHWTQDRRQGGRLLGEVCHFIDICGAFTHAPATQVFAFGAGRDEAALEDDVVVAVRYEDGSTAAVSYASGGHPAMAKELVEVLGGGHSISIDDYRQLTIDGRAGKRRASDKGHSAQFIVLKQMVRGAIDARQATSASIHTMRTTLLALESLRRGEAISVPPPR